MTKQKLSEYPALKKRCEKLKGDIEDLRYKDIDVVSGKVKGSMDSHPYIERRFTVEMEVPEEAKKVREKISDKEREVEELEMKMREVEEFIDGIEDVHVKTIFEYRYLEGMSVDAVAEKYGYTKGRISQIVSKLFENQKD